MEEACEAAECQGVRVVGGDATDVCLLDSTSKWKAQGLILMIRSLLQIDLGYSQKLWNRNGCELDSRMDFPFRKPLVRRTARGNLQLIREDWGPNLPWVPLLQIHGFERPDETLGRKTVVGPFCLTTKDWPSG